MSPRAGLWLALLVPLSAAAQDTLLGCREIEDAAERVACYDRVVDRISGRNASGAPENGAPRTPSSGTPADGGGAPQDELFGRSRVESERTLRQTFGIQAPPAGIAVKVAALARAPDRTLVITLDNGQVWRQTVPMPYRLREGLEVRLYPSRWGDTYRLTNDQLRGYIQVERVR